MNQKLGTPVSRQTFLCSPSSSTFHIGFMRDATSSPRIFLAVTIGESKLRDDIGSVNVAGCKTVGRKGDNGAGKGRAKETG